MATIILVLERQAKKGGGDRYTEKNSNSPIPFTIYVPQSISRPDNGQPKAELTLTLE